MTVQSQIQDLVRQKLIGKHGDPVAVVDQILLLVDQVGELRCTLAGSEGLRFEIPGQEPCETKLDVAKGKLRALCARLSILCQESGQNVSPYGGEGIIEMAPLNLARNHVLQASGTPSGTRATFPHERFLPGEDVRKWKVRFKNTPSEQEFVISKYSE